MLLLSITHKMVVLILNILNYTAELNASGILHVFIVLVSFVIFWFPDEWPNKGMSNSAVVDVKLPLTPEVCFVLAPV